MRNITSRICNRDGRQTKPDRRNATERILLLRNHVSAVSHETGFRVRLLPEKSKAAAFHVIQERVFIWRERDLARKWRKLRARGQALAIGKWSRCQIEGRRPRQASPGAEPLGQKPASCHFPREVIAHLQNYSRTSKPIDTKRVRQGVLLVTVNIALKETAPTGPSC